MLSSPRALLYQTELVLPSIPELKISKDTVRSLYNKMFEPGGYQYDNLELQGDSRTLSTRRGDDRLSLCCFEDYEIRIEEKSPDCDIDEFVGIVGTVLRAAGDMFPVFSQRCRVQAIAQAHGAPDVIQLLSGRVANVWDKIAPFERPPSHFGVKFRFPPAIEDPEEDDEEVDGESNGSVDDSESPTEPIEHRGYVTLRLETYEKDPKQVWMEVATSYYYEAPLSLPDDLEEVGKNLKETYQFLADKARKFLNQFDTKDPDSGGGT